MSPRFALRLTPALGLLGLLIAIPFLSIGTAGIFSSGLNQPGTLSLLAIMLVFGGVALSYDLLFGYTGLLSFGHALYFAVGVYMVAIATTKWGWDLWQALLFTIVFGAVLALVLGAVSLRVGGIAFAMVTLAFAEAGSILADNNPRKWTGGEEGVSVNSDKLPDQFIGVFNTVNLYWLALGYAVVVFVVAAWAVASSPGRIWQAIRENELRVEVLGLRPFTFKLMVFVLASLMATAGGVVYVLLIQSASPEVTTPNFTLTLLVMVVLGGAGTRWGAFLGGAIYKFAEFRLPDLAGSNAVQSLPEFLEKPLSEPLFVLGTIFILIVFFVPGGLAGMLTGSPRRGLRAIGALRRERADDSGPEAEAKA